MRGFAVVVSVAIALVVAVPAHARPAVAVTSTNHLVEFDTANPSAATVGPAVTGLQAGESLLGIDYRPATGKLYGLGSTSRLYRINEVTGQATQIGAQFATPLSGTSFGFDFSPVSDRVRVVSDNEQNFRLEPVSATQSIDPALNPAGSVGAAAYTNAFESAPVTTLYAIDYGSDKLVQIGGSNGSPSPNTGVITPIGALGINAGADVDLDISYPAQTAFATIGGLLYTVNLTTGAATLVGQISGSPLALAGVAVKPLNPTFELLLSNNTLTRVTAFNPDTNAAGFTTLNTPGAELVGGIDFRPATGGLYGLGTGSHIFEINPATGDSTAVGQAFSPALNVGAAYRYGFDFLASEGAIRVVTDADQNLRLDADTGQVTQVLPNITPGTSSVTALAGDRNFAGATGSSLLGIDTNTSNLVRVNADGTLTTVGGLNIPFGGTIDPRASFDIVEPGLGFADLFDSFLQKHNLYLVDLQSGRVTAIGTTSGTAATVYPVGLAIVPRGQFRHGAATPSVGERAGQATLTVNRVGGSDGPATVEYATADGTATAGQDYTALAGILEFVADETSKTISVPIADDSGIEDPETFTVTLTDPTNGTTITPGAAGASVSIQSDDVPPSTTGGDTPGGSTPTGTDNSPSQPPPVVTPSEPDSAIGPLAAVARASKLTTIAGSATDPDGGLLRVEVAVVRLLGGAKAARAGCQAMQANGRLKAAKLVKGRCRPSVFVKANGLAHWSLKLPRKLPAGSYVVYSRAVDRSGLRETRFSAADGNRRAFRLKR